MQNVKNFCGSVVCMLLLSLVLGIVSPMSAGISMAKSSKSSLNFVILTEYNRTLDVGESFYLVAVTSNGEMPKFSSSASSIASVNTYGKVTAKKAGIVQITAKLKGAEASCRVKVRKTSILLNRTRLSLEHGESFRLSATVSSGSKADFRSSKSSVVAVDDAGRLYALKPGEAQIKVRADGCEVWCNVLVKQPEVQLSPEKVRMYRGQQLQLSAIVSSGIAPQWKSNRSRVAIVDETGKVTAVKNGTAIITAKVDGVSRFCEVTVMKPEITLSSDYLKIKCGKSAKLEANVSSGNQPTWTSGNSSILSVSDNGKITTYKKGTTYVTVAEDGTKKKCKVVVV